jgi:hypothetical protein
MSPTGRKPFQSPFNAESSISNSNAERLHSSLILKYLCVDKVTSFVNVICPPVPETGLPSGVQLIIRIG